MIIKRLTPFYLILLLIFTVPGCRKNESTPLHSAAHAGRIEMVELLIAKGADINATSNIGQTPLALAKAKGHTEISELLRKHDAKE